MRMHDEMEKSKTGSTVEILGRLKADIVIKDSQII